MYICLVKLFRNNEPNIHHVSATEARNCRMAASGRARGTRRMRRQRGVSVCARIYLKHLAKLEKLGRNLFSYGGLL